MVPARPRPPRQCSRTRGRRRARSLAPSVRRRAIGTRRPHPVYAGITDRKVDPREAVRAREFGRGREELRHVDEVELEILDERDGERRSPRSDRLEIEREIALPRARDAERIAASGTERHADPAAADGGGDGVDIQRVRETRLRLHERGFYVRAVRFIGVAARGSGPNTSHVWRRFVRYSSSAPSDRRRSTSPGSRAAAPPFRHRSPCVRRTAYERRSMRSLSHTT